MKVRDSSPCRTAKLFDHGTYTSRIWTLYVIVWKFYACDIFVMLLLKLGLELIPCALKQTVPKHTVHPSDDLLPGRTFCYQQKA